MSTTTLSKAYQITVPSVVRKALGLKPGDAIEIEIQNDAAIIRRSLTLEEQLDKMVKEFDRLNQEREAHMTPEQKSFAKMSKGWTANQYREYIDNTPEYKAYIKEKYGV